MRCRKSLKLIHFYLEGELAPALASELEEHLKLCDRCQRRREELRASTALMEKLPAFQAPAGFTVQVMARIRSLTPVPFPWARPALRAFALCSGLLALLLFLGAQRPVQSLPLSGPETNLAAIFATSPADWGLLEVILSDFAGLLLDLVSGLTLAASSADVRLVLGTGLTFLSAWAVLLSLLQGLTPRSGAGKAF